ncbi:Galactose-1-phosphate uridylyltransferase [Pseudobythopirellula maris]|uniref:Galactose-1-phosphate uridylyltransferase n=1 Tax=Pseudobythopirellula maris TaxID=2527991 RepID=A0A5C5ZTU4_9BACT|nr:DUF4931 domain-containing protein [Pseudobythopirellula maris]TWT90984.1 Galactose-1-phosphate uridylyltransferase [Pseudobythopirellula maris]
MDAWLDDPLTGRRVRIAEARAKRPNQFDDAQNDDGGGSGCPFCAGNESQTPASTAEALGADGRWLARVVPNRFPAYTPPDGDHEVVIESRSHRARLLDLDETELAAVVRLWAERLAYWRERCAAGGYQLLFKNEGPRAGASLEHAHSQLISRPEAPQAIRREWDHAESQLTATGGCAWCGWLERERQSGERWVAAAEGWAVVCPPAPRQPMETWILPSEHEPGLDRLATSARASAAFAAVLRRTVAAIDAETGGAAWNLIAHVAPAAGVDRAAWHCRVEILPRLNTLAGYELATGENLSTVMPEAAAARLAERF